MTPKEDAILQTITNKGEPMTAREIAEALHGKGKHQSIVFSYLQSMVAQGILEKFGARQPFSYGVPTYANMQRPSSPALHAAEATWHGER